MYQKVRFVCPDNGCTAGLVLDTAKLNKMTMADISRLFPLSEVPRMKYIQVSPQFPDRTDALNYEFAYSELAATYFT